jgi:dTDP-4-amino-4,6-dideoxygalactose transaminase
MRIGRTLPPAAAPLAWLDVWHGVAAAVHAGRSVRALEADIRREFRVRNVFMLSSGKAALTVALMALRSLSPRRDVVIPAFTCFSVPAAVLRAGLRPVLCDIDPTTFDFDHERLAQTINQNTLCVVAHHLFGVPADIARARRLCERHDAFLVEDAAQAMGAEVDGCLLGTLGDVGIFSLGRGKNITCGSGGIVVTNSAPIGDAIASDYARLRPARRTEQLKELARIVLMAIFIRPWLYWIPAALPFLGLGRTIFPKQIALRRLSPMQAGLLRNWRRRLVESNRVRAATASYFRRRLALKLSRDGALPFVRLPIVAADAEEKSRVYGFAQQRGLGVSVGYPTAINEIPEIRSAFEGQQFPSAHHVAERLLTLPTHQWLSAHDKEAIAELCRDLRAA